MRSSLRGCYLSFLLTTIHSHIRCSIDIPYPVRFFVWLHFASSSFNRLFPLPAWLMHLYVCPSWVDIYFPTSSIIWHLEKISQN
ncbi:hypothetical protein BKA58DRAFT_83667 [Alternaria rosae]|uniref:uncharacterized protein n=1 Tax=Alternaria rosae TaxID=1187941 RepID=UPI001E8D395F|nr:uncharacterized protein BKA58DRAFT_83667 [Alternaria rosae]KAH6877835.1 hypothetical protein BKA58DRAFT_83667 [Alternaria rosae]